MKSKFSAGLSTLMVLLITGSALAADTYVNASKITNSGTYNFKAGTYNDKLVQIQTDTMGIGTAADVTINIENNGTLDITRNNSGSIIDISDGISTPKAGKESSLTINGNLNISMPTANSDDSRPVSLLNGGDTLTINGNLGIKEFIADYKDNGYSAFYDGIRAYTGLLDVKKKFSIENMQITVNHKTADGDYPDAYVTGVYSTSVGERVAQFCPETQDIFKSDIILGTDNTDNVNIENINVKSDGSFLSVCAVDSEGADSTITFNGKTKINNITADTQNADIYVFGLAADRGKIFVNGDLSVSNVKGSTDAQSSSMVKALYACDGGKIYVNQNKTNSVKIDGDVATDDNSDSLVQINLADANSYINGALNGNINVVMAAGSVWRVKQGISTGDPQNSYLTSLTGDGDIEMDIDASKNNGNPHLFVQNLEGTHNLKLNNTNSSGDTSGANGNILVSVANGSGKLIAPASEGSLYWTQYELATKDSSENNYKTDWYLKSTTQTPTKPVDPSNPSTKPSDPSEPSKPSTPPHYTTSVSTLLSTITAGYDTWRSDTDKLSERLGELRLNGKDTEGVWVRTKGSKFGRHGGNGSYNNQQHTYQLGYDAVTSKNADQTTYTGFAAEYGKGNLSFDRGTGTMKSAGLGLYQTQLRESGHYLDFVYKFDKYKNDFHVADTAGNPISGKYSNNAMSLSAEYGRQNALKHGWYVEPQAALTLGYMWGNDFTTSNNIRVEQKNMPALIGRLGLNIGRSVSDKVNFYIKANINHDFLGKYDMQMTDLTNGDRLNASDKFASSWFDYGAGFTVKTSNNSYAYFDIERAVGGEYKKNWDWNVGLRWSF